MSFQDLDLDDFTAFEGGASTYSSPAVPVVFDIPSGAQDDMGTVSPQDLLVHDPIMSAPNSTTLTNLTSPSIYNDSPLLNDGYDLSPSHELKPDLEPGAGEAWYPLFPPSEKLSATPVKSDHSPLTKLEELDNLEPSGDTLTSRRKPRTSSLITGRHSAVAGVNSRRRDKPLPPITVDDPYDIVAMKRARNTLAARKSRERKAKRLDQLEGRIRELEAERDHWKKIAIDGNGT